MSSVGETLLSELDELINFVESTNLEKPPMSEELKESKEVIERQQKPQVVFVLGGPGSGKGTQCKLIVKEFGFIHLSAGDLLRAERNSGSKDAELINNYIKEGKIVPVEITVNLIKKAMLLNMKNNKYIFVIDGFPRNKNNLDGWNNIMSNFANVPFLLYLNCTEEEMERRILERGKNSLDKRIDDNKESIKKRFKVYMESTMPIINEFKSKNLCFEVNSIGDINNIFNNNIKQLFLPFIKKPNVVFVLGGPGSGKGTQCNNLVKEFGFVHLSAGDLLRAERNSGSKDAELINNYIKEGKIVPVEITVNLIKQAMLLNMRTKNKYFFIIDGFPRNKNNLDGWNNVMSNFANVPFLLYLNCTEEEMEKRILERAKKSKNKRLDDNKESIKKRFKVYMESTVPIINEFKKLNKCKEVESIGNIKDIYSNIRKYFENIN